MESDIELTTQEKAALFEILGAKQGKFDSYYSWFFMIFPTFVCVIIASSIESLLLVSLCYFTLVTQIMMLAVHATRSNKSLQSAIFKYEEKVNALNLK